MSRGIGDPTAAASTAADSSPACSQIDGLEGAEGFEASVGGGVAAGVRVGGDCLVGPLFGLSSLTLYIVIPNCGHLTWWAVSSAPAPVE